ncbi:MAG: YggS family pyridoxal phosphate-dependent enzyme, partial [Noviherbaspirillum sp.]
MAGIPANLQAVHASIVAAARSAGRDPGAIRLLAVSKTFGPDAVLEAAAAGQAAFGENYLQEALDKMEAVAARRPGLALEWH